MSRRSVSPIRNGGDPRDAIIRKLKDDLIVARGREKELVLLQNYMIELIEKTKLLTAETAKSDQEGKLKLELSIKGINELRKDAESLRKQLRNTSIQLGDVEVESDQIRKLLNSKMIEIEKLKKEGLFLHDENEKLLNQHYRLRQQEDETLHQIKKLSETVRDYEARVNDISRKIMNAKGFINQMAEENGALKEKLKIYEQQNNGMGNDLDNKQNKIDLLERTFAQKHEQIKNLVQNYIQLQHVNEKSLKEAKHKINLNKIEDQKFNQLNLIIKKTQKTIVQRQKQLGQVVNQSNEIKKINTDFYNNNNKLKLDLTSCQEHLQNLLKYNSYIQQQMQNIVREDEAIISVIRRKKLFPVVDSYRSLRTSRNEAKHTASTFH